MTIEIGILGADGRMGVALTKALTHYKSARLSVALTHPSSETLGQDIGAVSGLSETGVILSDNMETGLEQCDVLIDFSAPQAAIDAAQLMPQRRCQHMVSGTTGFSPDQNQLFDETAKTISLLRSGNFSPGLNALSALVELASEKLSAGWDIEILEMHHRHKVDAPSGTALLLGEAAAKGRGQDLKDAAVLSREGQTGARDEKDIGFATLRGGGVIGQHEVRLASELEMITLSHDAFDRSVFARGAIDAALWLAKQPKGLYNMKHVLGF